MEATIDTQQQNYHVDGSQQQLIELYQGPKAPDTVVALASPGTGKTTTISRIISKLVSTETQRKTNFIVLTFTRKTRYDLINKLRDLPATYEIKKYVRKRIQNFHSFAYRIVEWKEIIDEGEEGKVMDRLVKLLKIRADEAGDFLKEAKRIKEQLLGEGATQEEWAALVEKLKAGEHRKMGVFLQEYRRWLEEEFRKNQNITYDYSLLKSTEYIQAKLQPRQESIDLDALDLIIVDQFQDSNPAQLRMVQALLWRSKEAKLLMVGDFDQNIYTWRGSDIKAIDQFLRSRPHKIMNLGNSYRLGQSLKDVSQLLVRSFLPYRLFRDRFYKDYHLNAKGKYNNPLEVRTFKNEHLEVNWTINSIYRKMAEGIPLGDMTVLVRSTKTSFIRLLLDEIKNRKDKGQREILYDLKLYSHALGSSTIKYLLAVLSLLAQESPGPQSGDFVKRITKPIDYVGDQDQVRNEMIGKGRISKEDLQYTRSQNYMAQRRLHWQMFLSDWERIEELVKEPGQMGFLEVCRKIFHILRMAQWGSHNLQEDKIIEFYDMADEVEDSMDEQKVMEDPIFSVLKEILRHADRGGDEQKLHENNEMLVRKRHDRLQIQTIHTSKGLQFQVVFLCSLNYQFPKFNKKPNPFSIDPQTSEFRNLFLSDEQEKQELRVIYTAITRSSRYCYVSSSLDFQRPKWLKGRKINSHPHFKFLKSHALDKGIITQLLDQDVQQLIELMENQTIS